MRRNWYSAAAVCLVWLPMWGCGRAPERNAAGVVLEVFVVGLAEEGDAIRYARRATDLSKGGANPDTVARGLAVGPGEPVLLHSTSWRWERDGMIVLTYLAYCEKAEFRGLDPVRVRWDEMAPPAATDPLHPRPPVIREIDVLAHGLRHLSFLVRNARDKRMAAALSARSLAFFRAMCGQLAGRLEAAREFEECASAAPPL